MPVLSYVHQLFNADQCHAYIHTPRWQDRPLQCPRCQSQDAAPWGTYHYRPGCKRYWCNGCKRTFNDLTATLLHQSRRSFAYWILATFLVCLCFVRKVCRWAFKRPRAVFGSPPQLVTKGPHNTIPILPYNLPSPKNAPLTQRLVLGQGS